MSNSPDLVRTTLYLSSYVWKKLKELAYNGESSASEIINRAVAEYLVERPQDIDLSIHRDGDTILERKPRTIRFRKEIADEVQALAERERFSIASLVESLLIKLMGLEEPEPIEWVEPKVAREQPQPESEQPNKTASKQNTGMHIQVGDEIYDIGPNPTIIDMNGNPIKRDDKKT